MLPILLTLADESDRDFFRELYLRYHRLMFATVRRSINDPRDCEDVVQDALEKLAGKVDKLRELSGCALAAYIVFTVRNTAINLQKHRAVVEKHGFSFSADQFDGYQADDPTPEELAELREKKASLVTVWPRIPERDRDLLYRKYVLEETDQEIADALDCKKASVRMSLTRARRRAFELMKEDGAV